MHDDMNYLAVMDRVKKGESDPDDAIRLRDWIYDTPQAATVKAYLQLACNITDAH